MLKLFWTIPNFEGFIMATFSPERKRRIFDHLNQTTDFISNQDNSSNQMDSRKRRIMEHIERTRG